MIIVVYALLFKIVYRYEKIASGAGEVVLLAVNFAFFAVLLFAFENFVGVITPVGLKVKLTN